MNFLLRSSPQSEVSRMRLNKRNCIRVNAVLPVSFASLLSDKPAAKCCAATTTLAGVNDASAAMIAAVTVRNHVLERDVRWCATSRKAWLVAHTVASACQRHGVHPDAHRSRAQCRAVRMPAARGTATKRARGRHQEPAAIHLRETAGRSEDRQTALPRRQRSGPSANPHTSLPHASGTILDSACSIARVTYDWAGSSGITCKNSRRTLGGCRVRKVHGGPDTVQEFRQDAQDFSNLLRRA
ncbi:hypothetical protein QFZ96_008140 [Paraburkholderia youngii]